MIVFAYGRAGGWMAWRIFEIFMMKRHMKSLYFVILLVPRPWTRSFFAFNFVIFLFFLYAFLSYRTATHHHLRRMIRQSVVGGGGS